MIYFLLLVRVFLFDIFVLLSAAGSYSRSVRGVPASNAMLSLFFFLDSSTFSLYQPTANKRCVYLFD